MPDRTVPAQFVQRLRGLCLERADRARKALGASDASHNTAALARLEAHLATILARSGFTPSPGKPWPTAPPGTDVEVEKHPLSEKERLVIVDPGLRTLYAATGGDVTLIPTRILDQLGTHDGLYADPADVLVELAIPAFDQRLRKAQRALDEATAEQATAAGEARGMAGLARQFSAAVGDMLPKLATLTAENDQLRAETDHNRGVIDYLRSLTGMSDDGMDAAPARDARISVEDFISYRQTRRGRTYYAYGPDPETGKKKHHAAGDTLEEARALRAQLHPEFAAATPDAEPAEVAG